MSEPKNTLPSVVREVIGTSARLDVLASLDIRKMDSDSEFDRLTRVAARLFATEFALITLVDDQRQYFKSCFGVDSLSDTSVDISFCAHTIAAIEDDYLVVSDLRQDPRFADNPFVTAWPHVRFYAGAPIIVHGQRLGTLCVLAPEPRETVAPELMAQLVDLAAVAATLFALKDEARVRARTAAALIREEWRHALTLEAGKVGSWVWDVPSGEVSCNDTFRRMHGLAERGPIQIEQVFDLIDTQDRAAMRLALDASFDEGADYAAEVRAEASGRWLFMRGRVYQRDTAGRPLTVMGVTLDISESKETSQNTQLLLRELNHRVKNTLAMIHSVARQTIRQNPDPAAFVEAFSGRLRAISDAHVQLAERDWGGVHLYEIISSQLGSDFLTNQRAEIAGNDVFLPADHALGLGLILHELTTNAVKHGAWSNATGMVGLSWEIIKGARRGLTLNWVEFNGPAVLPPRDRGLGVKLIERGLAKILDSEVTLKFAESGVTAKVWLPLPG